ATVLSKWGAMIIVFPLIVFAVILALSLVLTLMAGIFVMIGGGNAWTLGWQRYSPIDGMATSLILFYVETLWYLPVMGWLVLASAWAKTAPFLWAVLPPVAIFMLEEMFLDSNHFLELVVNRLALFTGDDVISNALEREIEM